MNDRELVDHAITEIGTLIFPGSTEGMKRQKANVDRMKALPLPDEKVVAQLRRASKKSMLGYYLTGTHHLYGGRRLELVSKVYGEMEIWMSDVFNGDGAYGVAA